jgi:hypothetical protein
VVVNERYWSRAAIEGLNEEDARKVTAALQTKKTDLLQTARGGDRGAAFAFGNAGFFCLDQFFRQEEELVGIQKGQSVLYGSSIDPQLDSRFSQCLFKSACKGDTLLHLACRNGSSMEVLAAIWSHPESALLLDLENEEGKRPRDLLEEAQFFQFELKSRSTNASPSAKEVIALNAWAAQVRELLS